MDHYPVKVLLAAVLCLGVAGAAEASDLLGQSYVSLESLETGSGFRKLLVEEEPSEAIRRAVIRDMDIPRDQWKDTKYSYHRVDLAGDGKMEALVLLRGPWTSGTGGSTLAILVPHGKDRWRVSQTLTIIHSPLIAVDGEKGKWKDLLVKRYGGGSQPAWVRLQYRNGRYEGVNEGQEIHDISSFRGTLLFANDFILDDMTGRYLTLEAGPLS